jgi:hypothetical protein
MFVMLVALGGCDNTTTCSSDCPPVEGVWALQYLAPIFPCDAGTQPAPPGTVQFMREGSRLTSAVDGVALTGSVYDTFDFSIHGQAVGGGETVDMRAKYVKGSAADGGGAALTDGRLTREAGGCREERPFTGARFF